MVSNPNAERGSFSDISPSYLKCVHLFNLCCLQENFTCVRCKIELYQFTGDKCNLSIIKKIHQGIINVVFLFLGFVTCMKEG